MSVVESPIDLGTVKHQVQSMLDRLPDDCTIEDIQYHLFVIARIHKGLDQIARGEVISHEDVRRGMGKWLNP